MLFKKSCKSDTLALAVVSTRIVRLSQALPPLPEEPDMSSTRESHSPMELGAEIATEGEITASGTAILVAAVVEALGQEEVSHELLWHLALSTVDGSNDTGLPSEAQPLPPLRITSTCRSLDHLQEEAAAQVKASSESHANLVAVCARSELVSNETVTLDPALEKTAEVNCGAGRGALTGNTLMTFALLGKTTSYWSADAPDTVTLKM